MPLCWLYEFGDFCGLFNGDLEDNCDGLFNGDFGNWGLFKGDLGILGLLIGDFGNCGLRNGDLHEPKK